MDNSDQRHDRRSEPKRRRRNTQRKKLLLRSKQPQPTAAAVKAGLADRSGIEKGGHAKIECPLCKTTAPHWQ
ncbi:hypothetical protein F8388_026052 [Cannabis sativa]|uniref:Uncharacterized protein n=1 Tax=Cannabis sativa TaxID=3483 RepID=A0A7J6E9M5_CANSA|nr:hypothetical protein F8388_026052 [Cannabis sativa]KAF4400575.1 hypothetical protein G4B88_023368 [Cannabis sativa]